MQTDSLGIKKHICTNFIGQFSNLLSAAYTIDVHYITPKLISCTTETMICELAVTYECKQSTSKASWSLIWVGFW